MRFGPEVHPINLTPLSLILRIAPQFAGPGFSSVGGRLTALAEALSANGSTRMPLYGVFYYLLWRYAGYVRNRRAV